MRAWPTCATPTAAATSASATRNEPRNVAGAGFIVVPGLFVNGAALTTADVPTLNVRDSGSSLFSVEPGI
jgi:hypothetical protein